MSPMPKQDLQLVVETGAKKVPVILLGTKNDGDSKKRKAKHITVPSRKGIDYFSVSFFENTAFEGGHNGMLHEVECDDGAMAPFLHVIKKAGDFDDDFHFIEE